MYLFTQIKINFDIKIFYEFYFYSKCHYNEFKHEHKTLKIDFKSRGHTWRLGAFYCA